MDNKKIMVVVALGIFVVGGFIVMSFGNRGAAQAKDNQQQGESYDEMMRRMHPNQQINNGMSGHESKSPTSDESSMDIYKLRFSEAVGKPAPGFTLTKQDGSTFTLSDYKDKTVVVFFNEGAMCYPACWEQIVSLSEDKRFNNDDVVTVSIVVDEKEAWDKIIRSQPKFDAATILFDTTTAVSKAYDILYLPSSMHKGTLPGHTYFIVKKGIISYVLDDPNMAINNDAIASKL